MLKREPRQKGENEVFPYHKVLSKKGGTVLSIGRAALYNSSDKSRSGVQTDSVPTAPQGAAGDSSRKSMYLTAVSAWELVMATAMMPGLPPLK